MIPIVIALAVLGLVVLLCLLVRHGLSAESRPQLSTVNEHPETAEADEGRQIVWNGVQPSLLPFVGANFALLRFAFGSPSQARARSAGEPAALSTPLWRSTTTTPHLLQQDTPGLFCPQRRW